MTADQVELGNELARRYVCGMASLDDLVLRQRAHHYTPTIRHDSGSEAERADRLALADLYDLRAAELGLGRCYRGL